MAVFFSFPLLPSPHTLLFPLSPENADRRSELTPPSRLAEQEANESFDTTFELSDTLYATGQVEEVEEVYVWLGVSSRFSFSASSFGARLSAFEVLGEARGAASASNHFHISFA